MYMCEIYRGRVGRGYQRTALTCRLPFARLPDARLPPIALSLESSSLGALESKAAETTRGGEGLGEEDASGRKSGCGPCVPIPCEYNQRAQSARSGRRRLGCGWSAEMEGPSESALLAVAAMVPPARKRKAPESGSEAEG